MAQGMGDVHRHSNLVTTTVDKVTGLHDPELPPARQLHTSGNYRSTANKNSMPFFRRSNVKSTINQSLKTNIVNTAFKGQQTVLSHMKNQE